VAEIPQAARKYKQQITHKLCSDKAGVNFINILLVTFSYKSVLQSFSLVTVWLCSFFGARILAQKLLVNC
jgi:hypothetical protein